uniref:FERM domain-containing protein n=1 Tax=Plectus sambesii TaxID=2011161 RepID=A0A914X1S9_9BILA
MAKGALQEAQEHNGHQQQAPGSPQQLSRHQQSAIVSLLDGTSATFVVDNWLYNEKRIAKQLHGRPWEFHFEVKFYPPEPSTLSDDLTRYLLTLQVRRDIYTGK